MAQVSLTFPRKINRLPQLARALPEAIDELQNEVMEEVAVPVARQLVPVDKGNLQESIRHERRRRNLHLLIAGGVTINGVFVDYAPYVEKDQPFLKPTMEYVVKIFERQLDGLESRISRKIGA